MQVKNDPLLIGMVTVRPHVFGTVVSVHVVSKTLRLPKHERQRIPNSRMNKKKASHTKRTALLCFDKL